MTNFWVMIWAIASGVAKLPGIIFFSLGVNANIKVSHGDADIFLDLNPEF